MTSEKDRIRTILTSEDGMLFPTAARFLAFETTESAETCLALLEVAKKDRDDRSVVPEQSSRSERTGNAWSQAVNTANSNFH